jgi:23S rRNA pseudouridine1911/1915/1917 synthase
MEILYQDEAVVAVLKPPGLSVHDAPGPGRSLLRALREENALSDLAPVHRLDKDVSGVLLLARDRAAARALERRWSEVEKTYLALCEGVPSPREGVIDAPILENQTGKPHRLETALRKFREANPGAELPPLPAPKTSGVHPAGRPSRTRYRVVEAFGDAWSLVEVQPEQGRMHQLRVHLAHLGTPLAVDPLYGRRARLPGPQGASPAPETEVPEGAAGDSRGPIRPRVSLHAARLTFPHPRAAGRVVTVEAPLPEDLAAVLRIWRGIPR